MSDQYDGPSDAQIIEGQREQIVRQLERIIQLEGAIDRHNGEMEKLCDGKQNCGYENYARRCGNCWMDNMIDLPSPPIDTKNKG